MLLTLIPSAASSWLSCKQKDFTKPFVPPYAVKKCPGHLFDAAWEAIISMLPLLLVASLSGCDSNCLTAS